MAAEEFLDDQRGLWQAKFKDRLAASINMDRKCKPQRLGPNVDRSDLMDRWPYNRPDQHGWSLAKYNGVQY